MRHVGALWFLSWISGCGAVVGTGGAPPASDSLLTDEDRATWFQACREVVAVPPQGTHPANCELSASCQHADGTGHRGGHGRHDWCADQLPPNVFWRRAQGLPAGTGCDVQLGDRADGPFPDAATHAASNEVWEVKVHDYTCAPRFLQDKWMREILQSVCKEAALVEGCGYTYVLGIADALLYDRLVEIFQTPDFRNLSTVQGIDLRPLQACRPSSAFATDPSPDAPGCQAGD